MGKDSPYLWLRLDRALTKGETRTLTLAYHGDLIDRFGDWYFIKSSIAWYPPHSPAVRWPYFDLTFLAPAHLAVVAVGEESDSAAESGRMRTHPMGHRRARFATLPSTSACSTATTSPRLTSRRFRCCGPRDMHRTLSQLLASPGAEMPVLQGKNMKEQVGQDIVERDPVLPGCLRAGAGQAFLRDGDPLEPRRGVARRHRPLVGDVPAHQQEGFDQVFRAHEVAHQWWGIGVDYATYHDRWMSEGLSDFSGLWYLQTRRNDNDKYFDMLDRWKADIMLQRDDPIPIWLGHRVATSKRGGLQRDCVREGRVGRSTCSGSSSSISRP